MATYGTVFEFLRSTSSASLANNTGELRDVILEYLLPLLDISSEEEDEELTSNLKQQIYSFCVVLTRKWKITRNRSRFELENQDWLKTPFNLRSISKHTASGRPSKAFEDSSECVKRRKVADIIQTVPSKNLAFATKLALKTSGGTGSRSAAFLLEQATEYSPDRPLKIKKAWTDSAGSEVVMMKPDEALVLLMNLDLSRRQYNLMKKEADARNAKLYPSYNLLKLEKLLCYPSDLLINAEGASIPLQNLLDHTLQRLCMAINVSMKLSHITFQVKWGADGSSGFQKFHQKPASQSNQLLETDEGTMFVISMVPLILKGMTEYDEEEIIWQNPHPSSYRWCRPIRIVYRKETKELIREEIDNIKMQIAELKPGSINGVSIRYEMFLTMLDGKSINSLTGHGTQTCYICGATPKQMNDLTAVRQRPVTKENFSFGLTPLHLWIRFLECVLHIGYKLNFQKARKTKNTSAEECEEMESRKKMIQENLFTELGIRVDQVEQGKGKSNTGNVGRRFFRNYEISSRVTGLDADLIRRFGVILTVLGSGYLIDPDAFETYAMDTAQRYTDLYNWNYMPVSVHKVLIHGADIIRHCQLPIGSLCNVYVQYQPVYLRWSHITGIQSESNYTYLMLRTVLCQNPIKYAKGMLSEEAQETNNKVFKRVRRTHTRTSSAITVTTDLMHWMLIESDPYLTLKRTDIREKERITEEMKMLIKDGPEGDTDPENLESQESETDSD